MKKMIFPIVSIAFFAMSCEKTDLPSSPATTGTTINHSANRKFVDFNYFIYQNPESGEYSCPTPKQDCAKIAPNPASSFAAIDNAIANHAVKAFFNTTGWDENFPYLGDQDAAVRGLKDGTYTMVRKTNSAGDIFYIIIDANADPDHFDSTIYTTMIEHK